MGHLRAGLQVPGLATIPQLEWRGFTLSVHLQLKGLSEERCAPGLRASGFSRISASRSTAGSTSGNWSTSEDSEHADLWIFLARGRFRTGIAVAEQEANTDNRPSGWAFRSTWLERHDHVAVARRGAGSASSATKTSCVLVAIFPNLYGSAPVAQADHAVGAGSCRYLRRAVAGQLSAPFAVFAMTRATLRAS